MVEESETADLAAVEERYKALAPLFPGRVGLVHGRMKPADKDRAMAGFAGARARPAGRDDGDRGRGRRAGGDGHGHRACRAFRSRAIAPIARPHRPRRQALDLPVAVRLAARRGREAAARRSCARPRTGSASPRRICGCAAPARCWARGRAACRPCASPISRIHEELVAIAHDDARLVLERDPHLESERGQALRALLYLFRRDEAVQYLQCGMKRRCCR